MAYLLKYYTFSAKIKTLSEFHTRIATNQQIPSNAEIITTLRYFQQTLVGFLKELPQDKRYILKKYTPEVSRQSVFPNLNYSGLLYGLINLLDIFPQITSGQQAIGEAILDVFRALYYFLDRENLDQLPYAICSLLEIFPDELGRRIVHVVCDCIMPYLLTDDGAGEPNIIIVLLMIFQYNKNRSFHTWALESFMGIKNDLYSDVIKVIAKGSSESRITAANLLFHYWPINNPNILHRKQIQYRVQAWSPVKCEILNCNDKAQSVKVCYDPEICAKYGDLAPPLFICKGCSSDIQSEVPLKYIQQPMTSANIVICQNKGCESSNRMAVGTCFDEDCIRAHSFVPIRLCQECITCLHEGKTNKHRRQMTIQNIWGNPIEFLMIEAIVKLLKETSYQLESSEVDVKRPKWLRQLEAGQTIGTDVDTMNDERRMLSRFGVWMMSALCPPTIDATKESVGYILAMIFQWFTTTALLPNDTMGSQLEQLKVDFVSNWVNMALTNHYDVFIEILSPNLPEYGKVGGIWDKLCHKKEQMKEGLSKLLALMPYDIISLDAWNKLMPLWLQAMCQDISDDEINDLKILLCKIFEPDLCPLPFETEKVYGFMSDRLENGDKDDILNVLQWLHLLTRIDITIQLNMLLDMFNKCALHLMKENFFICANSIPEDEINDLEPVDSPLLIQVIMSDILLKQMELNTGNENSFNDITKKIFHIEALLLDYPIVKVNDSEGTIKNGHTCQNPETDQFADCDFCQQAVFLYQSLMELLIKIVPQNEIDFRKLEEEEMERNAYNSDQNYTNDGNIKQSKGSSALSPLLSFDASGTIINTSLMSTLSGGGITQGNVLSPTSGNSEFTEAILSSSDVIELAEPPPLPLVDDDEVSKNETKVESLSTGDESKNESNSNCDSDGIDNLNNRQIWKTAAGKFKFKLCDLPSQLRLIYSLLKNIDKEVDPDAQYFLLECLKYLCLHYDSFSKLKKEHRGFIIWLQENLLIPKLYTLLRSDYSQVGQLAVKLISYAITLPYGEEIFWNIINDEFTSEDWKIRFKAVERVFILAHFVAIKPLKLNKLLMTSLSCAFCHLIISANDPNCSVSQRAILSIQALPSTSLQIISLCLEAQFDSCIIDRPLIIQRLQLLTQLIPNDQQILSWDFFIQHFETLALEAQIKNQGGESTFVQDLLHTNPTSDLYQKKVTKARKSLNEASHVRSIVKSLRINSLKHQLSTSIKENDIQKEEAAKASSRRGRRSAIRDSTLGTTARFKLKKVLMYLRVIGAFKKVGGSLSAANFFSSNIFSRRSPSPGPEQKEICGELENVNGINNLFKFSNGLSTNDERSSQKNDGKSSACQDSGEGVNEKASITYYKSDQNENSPSSREGLIEGSGRTNNKKYTCGGGVKDYVEEETNLCLLLNRVVDLENPERHTLYLIISLFCDFLCNTKSACDEKSAAKKQSILLRHFNTLLGYSHSEKCFIVPAIRLRKSAVCNAFMNGLPEILDCNLLIGNQMLLIIVQLLHHLPSPNTLINQTQNDQYTLSLLTPLVRQTWLNTLILILYKYRFDNPPISDIMIKLINIVLGTLDLQCHTCTVGKINNDDLIDWSEYSDESGASDIEEYSINPASETILEEVEEGTSTYSLTKNVDDEECEKTLKISSIVDENVGEKLSMSRPNSLTAISIKSKDFTSTNTFSDKIEYQKLKDRSSNYRKKKDHVIMKKTKKIKNVSSQPNYNELVEFRCGNCNEPLKNFDEESLSLCVIALETFCQREPTMAAPILLKILMTVSKFIETPLYSWHETTLFVPGNSRSTAKQLLRVIFHQLSNCGIAYQLFDSKIENPIRFWTTVSFSLTDFNELNPISLINCLLEDLSNDWPQNNRLGRALFNLAAYVQTLPTDNYLNTWSTAVSLLETFFRKYYSSIISSGDNGNQGEEKITSELKCSIIVMKKVMKIQNFSTFKSSASLVEAYSKWLTESLHHTKIDLIDLLGICTACNRALIRERDKQCITKAVVFELIQAIKFKVKLHENNYLRIVDLILQDTGELVSVEITDDQYNTGASDAVKPYMNDILEFVAEIHVLSRLKKQTKTDSVGGEFKAGLAKIVAVEMSRNSGRDNRPVIRYIPWLLSPPNVTQAAPGAFAESVTNVRILSWLLLGALHSKAGCTPIPIESSNQMADYIHFVLAGFADQSKQSVVHMSALFHAFHLCQIWTVYCEQHAITCNSSDVATKTMNYILDFWSRVTPAILQLLSHSKVLADMVNLHFVNTMQALQQVNSAVLCQLYPMWQPILTAYHNQIPTQLRVKLEACENQPSLQIHDIYSWIKRVRFKISQIELQTSAASPFYNV
ncbi:Protein unc-79 homolog [Strongyloides ratti]|uniref:Protein unc-79 homolog n=1 Tax=Strongyloides ratti TaxID=34506 RepID=A0A090L7P9_STRRB|nr:Protein unc-79 homolog [Strongyloides ratti]CEF65747.1 Protein unc-79 homolog [Strongyloides ratti]